MRVLLVEDDTIVGDGIVQGLSLEGHAVDWLVDGREAAIALDADPFDAVILDLALPGKSGFDVLAQWRASQHRIPVLVMTARDDTSDCIAALDCGADDYITKPVALGELEARLRALLRRANGYADNCLRCGAICIDREAKTAWVGEQTIDLSAYEFVVLETLLERPGRLIAVAHLESRLYGWSDGPDSNSVQVMLHKLRKKIGADRIETVRGLGYRIVE